MDSEPVARTQPGMRVASTAGSGLPGAGMLPAGRQTPGCPFRGRGLAARVLPFAVVAVLAEASLALPPGVTSEPAAIISVALLAATAAAFALPWGRLPGWAPVLMPLGYAGSVLALTIAAGSTSGVAIVALMPVVWAALFHRWWEAGRAGAGGRGGRRRRLADRHLARQLAVGRPGQVRRRR